MKSNFQRIVKSYKKAQKEYNKDFKSDHWERGYKKRNDLFKFKNLKNFRNNSLSFGLDTRTGSLKNQKLLYEEIKRKHDNDFVNNNLSNKNVGNLKNCFKNGEKFIDPNALFHIDCTKEILDCINKKDFRIKNICEIGAGFGSMSRILINLFKSSKLIIIDLPEANYLCSYYLFKHFPSKKFLFYSDLKANFINQEIIKDYDIIILPAWVKLQNLEIDIFANVRSFMEMDIHVIEDYFNTIQKIISKNGIFLNINRYDKRTVGYPIKFDNYPYDKNWSVLVSKPTWTTSNAHTLITQRNFSNSNIFGELKKIRYLRIINYFKVNKHLIKNILPENFFLFLQKIKHKYLQ